MPYDRQQLMTYARQMASVSLNFAPTKKCFTNVNFVRMVVRTSPICSQICDRIEAVADSGFFASYTARDNKNGRPLAVSPLTPDKIKAGVRF